MSAIALGIGIGVAAAGCTLTSCVLLYRYRRKIKKLLNDLKKWVTSKIRYLTQAAKQILTDLCNATESLVRLAYQALEKQWETFPPEERRNAIEFATDVASAGIQAAKKRAKEKYQQLGDLNSPIGKLGEEMMSRMGSFITDFEQTGASFT